MTIVSAVGLMAAKERDAVQWEGGILVLQAMRERGFSRMIDG